MIARRTGSPLSLKRERLLKNENMLNNAIVFLIIALVAAVLGFGVVAGTAALIAKICFVIFLVLFVVSLITGKRKVL
jgi:uncharacterized membrane protein YtjA (UPF0391 family)